MRYRRSQGARSVWLLGLLGLLVAAPAHASDEEPPEGISQVLAGSSTHYTPLTSFEFKGMKLTAPISLAARVEGLNSFPVDSKGTALQTGVAADMQVRIGLTFNTSRALAPFNLAVEYEHDVLTGPVAGEPSIAGQGYPNSHHLEQQLRKASLRASLGYMIHLQGGLMTSHWGLGLLANDGSHGWHPGSAHFADPRGGDRVARLMLATGPLGRLGVVVAFGHDWVMGDDVLLENDSARQFVAAATIGKGHPTSLGFYGAYRTQEAGDGDRTTVTVLDLYGRTSHTLGHHLKLTVEAEAAVIVGQTDLGSSTNYPQKDVLQLGMALRASLDAGKLGGVLDVLFASGDANFDDSQVNGFKTDPNYELSLFAYRYVLSGITGRAPHTAADPTLSGKPSEDLDRFPTRESSTNTVAIFPRAWWRPIKGLEIYGGPLFAFSVVPQADPFNSRTDATAGGAARNAYNAAPGGYLGTELDVGLRYRMLAGGTQLTAGLEGGVFFAGDALQQADSTLLDPVGGGRLLVRYQF